MTLEAKRTSVFLSYAREDRDHCAALRVVLEHHLLTTNGDWHLGAGDPDYEVRLRQLVASSTVFVVLLSPHSGVSEACRKEMGWALEFQKLVLPVQLDAAYDGVELPAGVRRVQWISPGSVDDHAAKILESLHLDLRLFELNAALLPRALSWGHARQGELVSGAVLSAAQRWVKRCELEPNLRPRASAVLREYLAASSRARLRTRVVATIAATVLLGAAGVQVWHSRTSLLAEGDARDAADAEASLGAQVYTSAMLSRAASAVEQPARGGRTVSAKASRTLVRALLRSAGVVVLEEGAALDVAATNRTDAATLLSGGSSGIRLRNLDSGEVHDLPTRRVEPTAAALSADGRTAIVGFVDGSFMVANAGGSHRLHEVHSARVAFVAMNAEGTRAVVARTSKKQQAQPALIPGWDAEAELWDLEQDRIIKTFFRANAASLLPGDRLLLGTFGGEVSLLSAKDGQPLAPLGQTLQGDGIDRFVTTPTADQIAVLRAGKRVELFRPLPGAVNLVAAREYSVPPSLPLIGAFSPDGSRLALADPAGRVTIVPATGDGDVATVQLGTERASSIAFCTGGLQEAPPLVIVGDEDGRVHVVYRDGDRDRQTSTQAAALHSRILHLACRGPGRVLVAASDGVRVLRYDRPDRLVESAVAKSWPGKTDLVSVDRETGCAFRLRRAQGACTLLEPETGKEEVLVAQGCLAGAFSKSGSWLATLERNGRIQVRCLRNETSKREGSVSLPQACTDETASLSVSSEGDDVVVFGGCGAHRWSLNGAHAGAPVLGALETARSADYVGRTHSLLVRDRDGTAGLFDLHGKDARVPIFEGRRLEFVEASAEHTMVMGRMAKDEGNAVRVLNHDSSKTTEFDLPSSAMNISSSAIFLDGKEALIGGRNGPDSGPVFVLGIANREVRALPALDELLAAFATLHYDEHEYVAAVTSTGSIAVWDAGTYDTVAVFPSAGWRSYDHALAFTPRGHLVHADGERVELVPVVPERLLELARQRLSDPTMVLRQD